MQTELRAWTVKDSIELYNVGGWGRDFFTINEAGNVEVTPAGPGSLRIDLKELVDDLRSRGSEPPAPDPLLRHPAHARRAALRRVPARRSPRTTTRAPIRGVYPIKVNQQRHVVEELMEYGRPYNLGHRGGLQARAARGPGAAGEPRGPDPLQRLQGPGVHRDGAARAEARAPRGHHHGPHGRAGHDPDRRRASSTCGPVIGVRARLTTKGAGKWVESTGDRSKFGLTTAEIVAAVEKLRALGMLDCLQLLHFHIGSPDHEHPRGEGRAARGEPHLRRARTPSAPTCATSTAAAASASTTTAARPTSTPR